MFCAKCGHKIIEGRKFCSECGSPAPDSGASRPAGKTNFILPPVPTAEDKNLNYKDNKTLSQLASKAGYAFYAKGMLEAAQNKKNAGAVIMTVVSMIFIFCTLMGGHAVYYYNMLAGFKNSKGSYASGKSGFSASFPEGWKAAKKPDRVLKVRNAIEYFVKGSSLKPDIQAMVFDSGPAYNVPEQIPPEILNEIESEVQFKTKYYAKMIGMKYEYLGMNLIDINERDAIWVEGNIWQKGSPKKRDFTFYAFGSNRQYYVKFIFKEENVDVYWPEIKEILNSVRFN